MSSNKTQAIESLARIVISVADEILRVVDGPGASDVYTNGNRILATDEVSGRSVKAKTPVRDSANTVADADSVGKAVTTGRTQGYSDADQVGKGWTYNSAASNADEVGRGYLAYRGGNNQVMYADEVGRGSAVTTMKTQGYSAAELDALRADIQALQAQLRQVA